jgi:glycosyltransferase involved in cell wall biosynthesis
MTQPARRVLILGSYAPSLVNFRGPLIRALVERGHDVVAASPDIDLETERKLRELGADSVSVPISNVSVGPSEMTRTYRRLVRLFRSISPDVVVAYTIKPVILGALAARAASVPRVIALITGVGFAFTGDAVGLHRRLVRAAATALYRVALRRTDLVLFQNEDDRAFFRDLGILSDGARSAIVDGSGVDIDHFAVAPLPQGASFLMIARLLYDKGIREFAAAAKRIKAEHPDIRVSLVGYPDGSPDALDPLALDALVSAGIDFRGRLEDVRPAIAECSVYVLPSYREGTPRSVLEAMAMGRAIITTDAPGCRETVVDGVNGLLVPPRDSEALYRAMKLLVREPQRIAAMGAQSRNIAETRYDARKVSADIVRHAGL